jgi:predicted nucleic acid-binding protein
MAKRRGSKIFLDSNVVLSGLFSDRGSPRIILDLLTLRLPMLAGSTGRYNILEIERNLKKKMPSALPLYRKYISRLRLEVMPLPGWETVKGLAGVIADKDIPVLPSAIASGSDYLVTGDKKDFDRIKDNKDYSLTIVSPSEFIEKVVPEIITNWYKA